jgi:hypothetical protein
MSVTQLCFKLNPKERLGYFWTLRLPRSRNAPKQLLKPDILPQIPEQSIKDIQKQLPWEKSSKK